MTIAGSPILLSGLSHPIFLLTISPAGAPCRRSSASEGLVPADDGVVDIFFVSFSVYLVYDVVGGVLG